MLTTKINTQKFWLLFFSLTTLANIYSQNRSLHFDGIDDYILGPNNAQLELTTGTVELWIKPEALLTRSQTFIAYRSLDGFATKYLWNFLPNLTGIGYWNGAFFDSHLINFTPDQWYHLAFVDDNVNTKVYVNGSLEWTSVLEFGTATGGSLRLLLGNDFPLTEFFQGEIDEVRIWSQARTAAEINATMNVELTGAEANLVAYYNFETGVPGGNNAGLNTLTDITANNIDGTLTNFALNGTTSNWAHGPNLFCHTSGMSIYNVNTVDMLDDGFCDLVHCSLIEAINASNNIDTTASTINFNLVGSAPFTLESSTGLEITNCSLTIDGTSQPGWTPGSIALSHDDFMSADTAFKISNVHNIVIKGLEIKNFTKTIDASNTVHLSIENNIIADGNILLRGDNDSTIIRKNWIGTDPQNNDRGISEAAISIGSNNRITLDSNMIGYSPIGLQINDDSEITMPPSNTYICNELNTQVLVVESQPLSASINMVTSRTISGISDPGVLYLYLSNNESCPFSCNATTFIDSIDIPVAATAINPWSIASPPGLTSGSVLTAYLRDNSSTIISDFASCYTVLPINCSFARRIPVNSDPCATAGGLIDLNTLPFSVFDSTESTSSCLSATPIQGAWFALEVPLSGNLLIRTGINNNIRAVVELRNSCVPTEASVTCQELDSIPFLIVEDQTPGETLYIRAWNKDTSLSNTILHITAHDLGDDSDPWVICGNGGTSNRDPDRVIIEFAENISDDSLKVEEELLESIGLTKVDSCQCTPRVIQLWEAQSPAELETNGITAKSRRVRVEESDYNYHFDPVEFQVNTRFIGNQSMSSLSMDDDANFVVGWIDEDQELFYVRNFSAGANPNATEIKPGHPDSTQVFGDVAVASNGQIVLTWQQEEHQNNRIYTQIFTSTGDSITQKIKVVDNGFNPAVVADTMGNFIVSWHISKKIFFKRFTADGISIGSTIEVAPNMPKASDPNTSITTTPNGQFYFTWAGRDEDQMGIYVQAFNIDGLPRYEPILVNSTTDFNQINPEIATNDTSDVMVVWQSATSSGTITDFDIYGRRIKSNGDFSSEEFLINTFTENDQQHPAVAFFKNEYFLVAWDSENQIGEGKEVYMQLYNSVLEKVGPDTILNILTKGDQAHPILETNGSTILMTSWEDSQNDGSLKGIFGQRFELIDEQGQKSLAVLKTTTPSALDGEVLKYPEKRHEPFTNSKYVRLAIVDTGVDTEHPILNNALWRNNKEEDDDNCYLQDTIGYNFIEDSPDVQDSTGHGTQINGVIARDFTDEVRLELVNLKFHQDVGKVFDAICAIYYAVQCDTLSDIINLSWGFESKIDTPFVLLKALKYAAERDALIVTSAGNASKDNNNIKKYPANFNIDNMIVVTAYKKDTSRGDITISDYASFGSSAVDIAAPGYMESTDIGGLISTTSGTSFAAGFVSRLAAIIKGKFPILSASEIKDCILTSARQSTEFETLVSSGGILDEAKAIQCAFDKAVPCLDVDLIVPVSNKDAIFRTNRNIYSEALIDGIAGTNVQFLAGEEIALDPGFTVPDDNIFQANSEECITKIDSSVFCISAPPEWCGYAIMTCAGGAFGNEHVAALLDLTKVSQAPLGYDWTDPDPLLGISPVPIIKPTSWTFANIGQIFGVAVNPNNGDIFFAASDVYSFDGDPFTPVGSGFAGPAGIYKSNFNQLENMSELVSTSAEYLDNPLGRNQFYVAQNNLDNIQGNGIGNITLDPISGRLFVTNTEDGRIYSISSESGIILDIYDPFEKYVHSEGMVGLSERLWAVTFNECSRELYFHRQTVTGSLTNGGQPVPKEIWKIAINNAGNFLGSEQQVFTLNLGTRSKITDIAFSADCGQMLLSERGKAHNSQAYLYDEQGSDWVLNTNIYVGNTDSLQQWKIGQNASGGVSFGGWDWTDPEGNIVEEAVQHCDSLLWISGDCLDPLNVPGECNVYGMTGVFPQNVDLTEGGLHNLFIDLIPNNSLNPQASKFGLGDVEIFNCCCTNDGNSQQSLALRNSGENNKASTTNQPNTKRNEKDRLYLSNHTSKAGVINLKFYSDGNKDVSLVLLSEFDKVIFPLPISSAELGWHNLEFDVRHLSTGTFKVRLKDGAKKITKSIYVIN